MHAVIRTGGKQYRIKEGDELRVEKLAGNKGDEILFEEVLSLGEGADLKVGAPLVDGAKVKAQVVHQGRHRKVIIFKKRRRKGYQVKRGHRQHFTHVRITAIEA